MGGLQGVVEWAGGAPVAQTCRDTTTGSEAWVVGEIEIAFLLLGEARNVVSALRHLLLSWQNDLQVRPRGLPMLLNPSLNVRDLKLASDLNGVRIRRVGSAKIQVMRALARQAAR